MTGSIDKYIVKGSSKPRWRYRIYKGKNDAGVKQYISGAGFEKQAGAADAMRAKIDELLRLANQPAAPEAITLAAWLKRWLDSYAVHTCQPKTLERYGQLVRYVTDSPTGEVQKIAAAPISTLKHANMESALRVLLKQKAARKGHLSARTVRHVAGVLQVALNEAFRLDLILVNPMLKVRLPSIEQSSAESLTPEQVQSLRKSCRGDWTFALIELALATGARRGEMLALTWANVDWVAGSVLI